MHSTLVHTEIPMKKRIPAFGHVGITWTCRNHHLGRDDKDVWTHNAWDHVPPPDDHDQLIADALAKQHLSPVSDTDKQKYNDKPARHWDNFYKANTSNFFRDRKWLHNEFAELVQATTPTAGPKTIAEVGCGAGNSLFPLLTANKNPDLRLLAYDYSSHAVKLVQNNPLYESPNVTASVWDLTSESLPPNIQPESIDIVILVFVLSALHPDEWSKAVNNIHKLLKPKGLVLLRDYGRYDLTQLRFKSHRLLDDNFYIRGDKTRVYFFQLDELALLFTGKARDGDPDTQVHPSLNSHPIPRFETVQLAADRRLIVNRKRLLKMYRVWVQAKFIKL